MIRSESRMPFSQQFVEAAAIKDPITKDVIILGKTADEGAVRETRLRSREWFRWSDWEKTRLPAKISRYVWTVELAAIGWNGGESRETIYRWDAAALKLILVFIILAV